MLRHRAVRVGAMVVGVLVLALALRGQLFAPPAPPAPPTIDDLVGVWDATMNMKTYNLSTGEKAHGVDRGACTITKTGPLTVELEYQWDLWGVATVAAAYAGGGILVMGRGNDNFIADPSATGCFFVRGRPGRLTAKGQFIQYDFWGGALLTYTISLKQQH